VQPRHETPLARPGSAAGSTATELLAAAGWLLTALAAPGPGVEFSTMLRSACHACPTPSPWLWVGFVVRGELPMGAFPLVPPCSARTLALVGLLDDSAESCRRPCATEFSWPPPSPLCLAVSGLSPIAPTAAGRCLSVADHTAVRSKSNFFNFMDGLDGLWRRLLGRGVRSLAAISSGASLALAPLGGPCWASLNLELEPGARCFIGPMLGQALPWCPGVRLGWCCRARPG